MKIGIIGLGLIGGSIAKEIKIRSISTIVVNGAEQNKKHADRALQLKLVDQIKPLIPLCQESDIIVLAVPIHVIVDLLPSILEVIDSTQVVIDTGSTKAMICESIVDHPNRKRFVAAHPLAGTEFSGPDAAIMDLFKGKKNIICEKEKSDDDAIAKALNLFDFLGMDSYYLDPKEHDKHMAYVSHLSHVSSFILSQTVLDIEKDENQIFNLASTGFASTARLAKSNAETWAPIFSANSNNLVEAIDNYIDKLKEMRNIISLNKVDDMKEIIFEANKIKSVLDDIKSNPKS